MHDHHGEVPDWTLERLVAGDLSVDEARRVRARLEAAGELGRLDALGAANRAFLEAHPADRTGNEIRRRARVDPATPPRARSRWRRLVGPGALAASAAVLSIWLVRGPAPAHHPTPSEPEVVRLKGHRPHLILYKKIAGGSERLTEAKRVRPGDTVQVAYVAAGRRFGVIASIDPRGAVTLHLPEEPGAARELSTGEQAISHAFVLDDARFERFVFVAGDRNFPSSIVVDALRSGDALPPDLSISEFVLEKELP